MCAVKCGNDCSGHGKCMTISQAGSRMYNRNARVQSKYTGWDANRIQGCVCEDGWEGFDCSQEYVLVVCDGGLQAVPDLHTRAQ